VDKSLISLFAFWWPVFREGFSLEGIEAGRRRLRWCDLLWELQILE